MTYDLSDWVEEGAFEQSGYGLEGMIKFSHMERPIHLRLMGTCHSLLDSSSVYFWNRQETSVEPFPVPHLANRQVGPTGRFDLSGIEVVEEPDALNPAPQYSSQKLILEWYGQNGHFQITLRDAVLDFLKGDEACPAPPVLLSGQAKVGEPMLTELVARIEPPGPDTRCFFTDVLEEVRALDEELLTPSAPACPLAEHFDPPYLAPASVEDLSDAEIETELQVLLAKLARLGICIDPCAHFSPRDLYRCLLDEVLPSPHVHPGLTPIHGLEHFPTYDSCSKCQKEMEEEFEFVEAAMNEMEEGTSGARDRLVN